jgi:adenylate cyclase
VGETLDAARAYELLGLTWFLMMESGASLVANLRSLNLSETVAPSAERANGCATIGMSAGVVLGRRVAERYFRLGLASGRAAGDEHACGRVWHMKGFYLIGEGQWVDAQAALERARRIFERLGDTRWREMTLLTLGNLHQMRRRYAESLSHYAEAERTSAQRGDVQARAWSAVGSGGALQALGRLDESLAVYDQMTAWLADDMTSLADRGSVFSVCGIKALAHLRRGDLERAWTLAAEAADLAAGSPLLIYYALPGRTSVAQVTLGLWERGYDPPFGDVRRAARRAVADLRAFARWFPIARPQAHLWQGVLHALDGRSTRARAAWERAAAEAARLDMPHDEGLAHHEIARRLARDDPERRTRLESARRLYEQAGAVLEAAAAHADLVADAVPLATVA